MKARFATIVLFLLLVTASRAQKLDRMTFKSFATAKGYALFLDLESREVLWRFENDLEMRFPFADVNVIFFGTARGARITHGIDSAQVSGVLTEFSPDRGVTLRTPKSKTVAFILTDVVRIELDEPIVEQKKE